MMIRYVFLCMGFITGLFQVRGQTHITFRHLHTSHGLSYVGVTNMCTDKQGNLWIGTGNGLNKFNGKTIERFFATEYPQLKNSNIIQVACDQDNRIWVLTANGNLTLIDEKRNFHRVGLYVENKFVRTRWILETGGQFRLLTSSGHFALNSNGVLPALDSLTIDHFTPFVIHGFDSLQQLPFRQVFQLDEDHYLFVREDGFSRVNYQNQSLDKTYAIPHCTALAQIDERSLLWYDRSAQIVKLLDFSTGVSSMPFSNLKDQFGKPVTATFLFAEKIKEHQYILTTQNAGIYLYDHQAKKIYHHRHHFADATSLSDNLTSTLEVTPSGWVFITCNPIGISYFNSQEIINNQEVFTDQKGKGMTVI